MPRVLGQHGYASLQTGKWWQGHFSRGGFTDGMTRGDRHGDDGLEIGRKTMQPIHDFIDKSQAEQQAVLRLVCPDDAARAAHAAGAAAGEVLDKTAPSPQVARYWAMVEWFDETVGRVCSTISISRELARDTIVIYLADNGWIQNPDGPRYAPKSKQSPYDGGLATPDHGSLARQSVAPRMQ